MYLTDLLPLNIDEINKNKLYIGNEFNQKYYPHSIEGEIYELSYDIGDGYFVFYSDIIVRTYGSQSDFAIDFYVFADDCLVAYVPLVHSSEVNRSITAFIYNAKKICLRTVVHGNTTQGCGAWLNPQVHNERIPILAALNDINIIPPDKLEAADTCMVTVVDVNFIPRLDTLLYSFFKNGDCENSSVVVFAFGDLEAYESIASKYPITLIGCNLLSKFSFKIKTAALSVANFFNAKKYIYLDADMLVLDSIKPIFDVLDVLSDDKVVICSETSINSPNLGHALCDPSGVYYAEKLDLEFLGLSEKERDYPLVINNGVYAGSKKAILGLESLIRSTLPNSAYWEKFAISSKVFWREQAIFNIALARGDMGVGIDEIYNLQLNSKEVQVEYVDNKPVVYSGDKKVRVLHFNGMGRDKCIEIQNYYEELAQVDSIDHSVFESKDCANIINNINKTQTVDSDLLDYCILMRKFVVKNKFKNVLILDDDRCLGIASLYNLDCVYLAITPIAIEHESFEIIQSGDIVAELSNMVGDNVFDCILINNIDLSHNFSAAFIYIDKILENGGTVMINVKNLSEKVLKKLYAFTDYVFAENSDYKTLLMVKKEHVY